MDVSSSKTICKYAIDGSGWSPNQKVWWTIDGWHKTTVICMKQVKSFFGISAALSLHAQTLLVTPVRCSVCLSHSWPSEIWCWHSFFKSASPDKAQNWCHFWDWTIQVSSTSGLANHLFSTPSCQKMMSIFMIFYIYMWNQSWQLWYDTKQSMFIFHTNYQVGAAGGINNCSPNSYRTWHLDMANRKRSTWMKAIPWIDLRYLPSGYLT